MIITIVRKPFENKSVCENITLHNTGGLNIDPCRVGAFGGTKRSGQAEYPKKEDGTEDRSQSWARTGHEVVEISMGRWPANLIFSHLGTCSCVGTKKIKSKSGGQKLARTVPSPLFVGFDSRIGKEITNFHYADKEGKETVADWHCEEDCPVKIIDRQSLVGGMHPAGKARTEISGSQNNYMGRGANSGVRFGDTGGASRFFKQVKE